MPTAPKILVFDSGLGGLTVFAEVLRMRPDGQFVYAADDAGFPYGRLDERAVVDRVGVVMRHLVSAHRPDAVVIACNTASTLVLPHLRAAFPKIPFVGTVPAVKPAAAFSRSNLISVLATPGTVARDYTHDLVRTYAAHCEVTLIGAEHLAGAAEARMRGDLVDDRVIAAEIAPCFVKAHGTQTDCVVLACTHYPLLLADFKRLAPWPVHWIDPASAIARRLDHVLRTDLGFGAPGDASPVAPVALFTGAVPGPVLEKALRQRGFGTIEMAPMPLLFA